MNMMGIQMKATILSLKINQEIDDSEFKFPENK
jgi:outer membrane lipoprotein-sorting protein